MSNDPDRRFPEFVALVVFLFWLAFTSAVFALATGLAGGTGNLLTSNRWSLLVPASSLLPAAVWLRLWLRNRHRR